MGRGLAAWRERWSACPRGGLAPHVGAWRWARGCGESTGYSTQASWVPGVRAGCALNTGQCPFWTEPRSGQAGHRAQMGGAVKLLHCRPS